MADEESPRDQLVTGYIVPGRELWAFYWPLSDRNIALVSATNGGAVETMGFEFQLTAPHDDGRMAEIRLWIERHGGVDLKPLADRRQYEVDQPLVGYSFRLTASLSRAELERP